MQLSLDGAMRSRVEHGCSIHHLDSVTTAAARMSSVDAETHIDVRRLKNRLIAICLTLQ